MRRPIEDGLSMLAGAGIGVALMYLLDPSEGEQRRQRLADGAREKFDAARQYAGVGGSQAQSFLSSAIDRARHLADQAREAIPSTAGVSSVASGLLESVRSKLNSVHEDVKQAASGAMDDVKDRASALGEDAIARKRDLVNRASLAIGRDEDHHYVGQSVCALGSLALGAGLIWAFDPKSGRSRRAWLRDKTNRYMNETGDFFRRTGRHMGNRMKGQVAVARRQYREMTSAGPAASASEPQEPISTAM